MKSPRRGGLFRNRNYMVRLAFVNCTLGDRLPGAERTGRLCTEAEQAGKQVAELMSVGSVG